MSDNIHFNNVNNTMKKQESKKNFAWPVTTLCKYDFNALKDCLEENVDAFVGKRIIIFGGGIRGTSFSILLNHWGYENIVFTDNNKSKVGNRINEYEIISYEDAVSDKQSSIIIISVENGVSICEQLKKDGLQENRDFFYIQSELYDNYVKKFFQRKKPLETMFLGDCGFTDISLNDTDNTNLEELIISNLGEDVTKVLAIHAMSMRAFHTIFKAHCKYIEKPKKVLLMTNLETFTGKQSFLPRSQHAKLIRMLSDALKKEDTELEEFSAVTQKRFEDFQTDYFTTSQDAMSHMSSEKNDRIVMRMNYLYKMDLENECIVYLRKFLSFCKEMQIRVILYIPPVNYEYGTELWGERFRAGYEENASQIRNIAKDTDNPVLDLSYLLQRDQFADMCTIDETVNMAGRVRVRDEIVNAVRNM